MLRAPAGAVTGGQVLFNDRYAWAGTDYAPLRRDAPLTLYAVDGATEYWSADLELIPPRLRYRFGLDTADGRRWFGWDGLRDTPAPRGAFEFAYVAEGDLPESPAWARGATFYQVFPDRFARSAGRHRRAKVDRWSAAVSAGSFLGGDLDGVVDHLDHIAALSTDALYLTPIFSSPSNHKYDTSDYFAVDPDFGGNAALRRLVDACHARGIRVILDGVFNHSGATWPPFADARRHGPASPFWRWFYLGGTRAGELGYETWATNVAAMPKLRTSEPALRDLILRIGRFWVEEYGTDGWRLDVANEVDHALWRGFRNQVRAANPEAFLLGEIWDWAMPWLRGDQFDSTMNYPLRLSILGYAGGADGRALLDGIDRLRAAYPEPLHHYLFNLLGSHDEDRPLSVLGGDRRRYVLAAGLLFTLPGIVSVYYGDEVGMAGNRADHGNRAGMEWRAERQDRRLLGVHRRLGALRRQMSALRSGGYSRLADDGSFVAFARGDGSDKVVVVANAGESDGSLDRQRLMGWLDGQPVIRETIAYEPARARLLAGRLKLPPMSVTLVGTK